jgi:arabinose-5-phosphate isomerase
MPAADSGESPPKETGPENSIPEGSESDVTALETARRVLRIEASAIGELAERVGPEFGEAVVLLDSAAGRVIASGIGKSGIIARKIASTLTSTGTPASFLHPVEGLHGDLGIVGPDDVAIIVSKSGDTDELTGLVAHLARLGVPIVALLGCVNSPLGRDAAVTLDCSVSEEACPMDLAPTASTTAALAMGDALAVAVFEAKGFAESDFARLHPGGSLGRRLAVRVADVMVTDEDAPTLPLEATMRTALVPLAEKRGTVAIVRSDGALSGVLTAGDLTRLMEHDEAFLDVSVSAIMSREPKTAGPQELGSAAVRRMEDYGVMALPVLDANNRVVGMVHLHDLLRSGAV